MRTVIKILAHNRDEVTGGSRKLHKVELHNYYPSPNIIRVIIWRIKLMEHVA
jgi:hypothetical protein